MLITIGSLFAAQQAGAVSFGKTWPLLLVVFGFMSLLERMLMPRYARPYGGPRQGPPSAAWEGLDSRWNPPYGQAQTPPQPPPPPFGGGPAGGAAR